MFQQAQRLCAVPTHGDTADSWVRATRENFPDLAERYNDISDMPDRLGFVGEPAEPDVWDYYVRKRVPKRFLGSQNAIRYLKPNV